MTFPINSAQYVWVRKEMKKNLRFGECQKNFPNNWSFFMASLKTRPYAIWGILENNTYATSHPNIGSFKDCYWGEMEGNVWRIYFEGIQIILKACWYNNWKNGSHIE